MKDKSKLTAIILVVLTIIVVIMSTIFNNSKEQQEESKISIVTNSSNFYTVNSCLYRVITYLASQSTSNMMLVLDENYKTENNIQENEVLSLFPAVEQGSTFVSTKMFYQNMSKDITKYYVEGYIEKDQLINENEQNNLERNNTYFIVYLDSNKKIFSIAPYSGEIFMDGELDEK